MYFQIHAAFSAPEKSFYANSRLSHNTFRKEKHDTAGIKRDIMLPLLLPEPSSWALPTLHVAVAVSPPDHFSPRTRRVHRMSEVSFSPWSASAMARLPSTTKGSRSMINSSGTMPTFVSVTTSAFAVCVLLLLACAPVDETVAQSRGTLLVCLLRAFLR